MPVLSLSAVWLALAALTVPALSQQDILNDTYFYSESPYVPATPGTGTGDWASAYSRAESFVAMLSVEEKVNLTGGITPTNGCSGIIPPISRLAFPGFCLSDAGNGVRATDFVNGYPSGIHVGASWNKDLALQRAVHMGGEFRAKGVQVALGPVVGPLGRVAEGGRNWEGFSNDPYLCGSLAAVTVQGVQSTGVITSTKHFVGNEQELYRNPTIDANNNSIESVSSNLDDKTMHELYLWPFADAVRAGTGCIMCSYNRLNNSYACQNSKSLNGLLKDELGFQGFVVSDWFAQHAGVATALSGLEMVMPSLSPYWGPNLTEAVNNGSVPGSRLDDMATRILAAWYQMKQDEGDFPAPGIGMPYDLTAPHSIVNALDPASKPTLLQGAIEGHVLVKNTNGALPLKSPRLLSVYGYDAKAVDPNVPGGAGFSPWSLGAAPVNLPAVFCGFADQLECPPLSQAATNGTLVSGGGSGSITPPYISSPLDALLEKAYQDTTVIYWDTVNVNATSTVDGASDACLVFINAWATEGNDRPGIDDDYSDELVTNIAAQCNNTIVVIHNAGVRLVDKWIDNPNVTAAIFAHLPGQDSGRALVEILYGNVSPSGKLPYTVAHNESDYGMLLSHDVASVPFAYFPQSNFSEGRLIDYRRFDTLNITPRFEFGFGLTYTTFNYSGLSVSPTNATLQPYPEGAVVPGGKADLWDVVATVTAQVTNSGSVAAAEIAQLYIQIPDDDLVRQLRGFDKQIIQPGETKSFEFDLTRRDLSVWDVTAQDWMLAAGTYTVEVGASSRNLPLSATLTFQ